MTEHTQAPLGPSRRNVLLAAAWTAPAIVVATALPARAASAPDSIVFDSKSAQYQASYWNGYSNVPALVFAFGPRLVPAGGGAPGNLQTLSITVIMDRGIVASPGSPTITVTQPGWTLSTYNSSGSAGTLTMTFASTQTPLPAPVYSIQQLAFVVELKSSGAGTKPTYTSLATNSGGAISSPSGSLTA